jgi:AcrR family transcriptional regulator
VEFDPEIPHELGRRERRKLEVRGRMLAAAVELFEARGVQATTVAEICERADVARKTFCNHFSTKQRLIEEIADAMTSEMLLRLEQASKRQVPTRERLADYFGGVARYGTDAGPMARELLSETIRAANDRGAEDAPRIRAAFESLVVACVEQGDTTLPDSVTGRHDTATLTEMVMGAYYAVMMSWAHIDGYPLAQRAAAVARFLGDAICGAPAGAPVDSNDQLMSTR